MQPRILLTPGEPAGIGPDLCVMAAQHTWDCELVVVADPNLLIERAQALQLDLELSITDLTASAQTHQPGHLKIIPITKPQPTQCGLPVIANADYVLQTITRATQLCLSGNAQALVTGPVQKSIINDAGITFSGHTEFIAEITDSQPVMMLITDKLRVALVTTHLPLSQVSQAITTSHLESVIRIVHQDLQQRFSIRAPMILICGLNPHAGEGGHLGGEEIEVITPVIQKLQQQGMNLQGPLPADTAFTPNKLAQADAILAMYHDQGLPVLKALGFGEAINITLGLPIIRTSVDHGTALSLAGSGQANMGSLTTAIHTAIDMATNANHCFKRTST